MLVLIVEDDRRKAEQIQAFVQDRIPDASVVSAESVRSGIDAATKTPPKVMVLDMSLPMFDRSAEEPGWKTLKFGGQRLAHELRRKDRLPPFFLISGYEAFEAENKRKSLDEIASDMQGAYGELMLGYSFYDTTSDTWRSRLDRVLQKIDAQSRLPGSTR